MFCALQSHDMISGERLQDHWSSGIYFSAKIEIVSLI